jgi:hypothetical protein
MVLKLAKEYGQAPQDVEQWDEYWVLRAIELMDGESLYASADAKRRDREAKRK